MNIKAFITSIKNDKFRCLKYIRGIKSAHNGFKRRVNVAAIVEKLHFGIFKSSETDVLYWQWVFLQHRDYWLRFQLLRIQSNATAYFTTNRRRAKHRN